MIVLFQIKYVIWKSFLPIKTYKPCWRNACAYSILLFSLTSSRNYSFNTLNAVRFFDAITFLHLFKYLLLQTKQFHSSLIHLVFYIILLDIYSFKKIMWIQSACQNDFHDIQRVKRVNNQIEIFSTRKLSYGDWTVLFTSMS